LRSATASSKRLGTYIDLYLLHWPSYVAPVCETIRAFEKLIDSSVIRFYRLTNFSLKGIEEANICAKKYDIATPQNHYSLLHRDDERDVIPYVQRENLLYMAYTTLEKGQLTRNPILMDIGRKYGKTASQVALIRLICIDNIVLIPKASNIDHLTSSPP